MTDDPYTTFKLDKIMDDFAKPTILTPKCKVITGIDYDSPPETYGKLEIEPCGAPYLPEIMCLVIRSD